MPRGQATTKQLLVERLKEIEAAHKERVKATKDKILQVDRRNKSVSELKTWLERRKLSAVDLLAMYRELKPRRADRPVKSKKPLHPDVSKMRGKIVSNGKQVERKGDPEFRRAIHEKRMEQGLSTMDLAAKIGVSEASVSNWETGRYVPKEEARVKILKALNLPMHLGAEATKKMVASLATRNGAG